MENNFKKYENFLWMDLTANSDFMVEGDATSFIEKWAENWMT